MAQTEVLCLFFFFLTELVISAQIQDKGGLPTQRICQEWFCGYKR